MRITVTIPWLVALLFLTSSPVPGQTDKGEGSVNFSFDQVSVRSFVKLVGDMTGRKFIVDEDVDGKITVVAPRIKRAEVFPLFVSILESSGCSVAENAGIYRVVKLPERKGISAPVVGAEEDVPSEGVFTKIIHLEHVSAADVSQAIEAKISGGGAGSVGAIEETNHLIVTDTASSIRRIEEIVAQIDRPGLARITEVVPLQFVAATELSDQLNIAMAQSESRGEQLRRRLPSTSGTRVSSSRVATVVPSPHSNQLILVGSTTQIEEMKRLIKMMDVEAPPGRGRLNAIFLKYLSAEEAAENLTALFAQTAGAEDGGPKKVSIAIQASPANNALLVDSSTGDFEIVQRLIEKLDQIPQQVHISVQIAELTISDDFTFGAEMAGLAAAGEVGETVVVGGSLLNNDADNLMSRIQSGIFPNGITFGVGEGASLDDEGNISMGFPGVINIEAIREDGRLEIVSETSLEAQDNREASVNIVNEIPILTSTVEDGSGTAKDVIQNIERVEVGIKLKLTPHIVPEGHVQMDLNPSIEAVIDEGSSSVEFTPTIARRVVSTTVTVPDGKTIVIAGLTREDQKTIERRVPILGSIPILGWLFRSTVDDNEKTNLLILVTPQIVSDMSVAEGLMNDWRTKTGLVPDEDK
ncbi:MAG: type II secretion system secretin GspD [Kiritimatiellia bacterium]|jgi:general secretion pathway protein D|nr:type II secretion system secretin GspD [Kiritimatiellia bacterium]